MFELLSGLLPAVKSTATGGCLHAKATGRRRARSSFILASTLLALAACDPFSTTATVETCVRSAMKDGEPFGSAKERADTEAQLRHYCATAAARKRM